MNRALLIACLPLSQSLVLEALQADVIHREKSLYRNIEVTETNERRCLIFAVRQTNHNQSCIDLADPKKIVFPYVRMTLAGLLVQPEIERALIVGLGGGTVPLTLSELYPDAVIDSVEIDPAVVRVAKELRIQAQRKTNGCRAGCTRLCQEAASAGSPLRLHPA